VTSLIGVDCGFALLDCATAMAINVTQATLAIRIFFFMNFSWCAIRSPTAQPIRGQTARAHLEMLVGYGNCCKLRKYAGRKRWRKIVVDRMRSLIRSVAKNAAGPVSRCGRGSSLFLL